MWVEDQIRGREPWFFVLYPPTHGPVVEQQTRRSQKAVPARA